MKAIILGDSYANSFNNTWFEKIFREFDLELVYQKGINGGCEFYTYQNFKEIIDKIQFDVAIFIHTEPGRLPNPLKLGISSMLVTTVALENSNLPKEIYYAAKQYYENLYYENFHLWVHYSLIKEIQEICVDKKIKQIHIPSFFYPETPMNFGLWITGGLYHITSLDYDYVPGTADKRKNHMSEELHTKLYKWLSPIMKEYLNNNHIDNLTIHYMDPQEVNNIDAGR